MLPQEIIAQKRDGRVLSEQALAGFCQGLTDGSWSEGQIAAMAMAICCRGMNTEERVALTLGMRDSGERLDWSEAGLDGPVLDKHSTGGVGDGVSLVLGPLLAACGAYVPMISGRGLGHTGGTLDKLEAIPGYQVIPDNARLRDTVRKAGVAIVGQSQALAPADGRLYAVRDVTGTVPSLDLITASILSKKLAAGLGGLIMDVKVGSGAFMPTLEASEELAQTLVTVAVEAGLPTRALLTDMGSCLSRSAGNALEIAEALVYLQGGCPSERFHQVVMALGSELMVLGKLASTLSEARDRLEACRREGRAAERLERMVSALGGPRDFLDKSHQYLERAPVVTDCLAEASGKVTVIDVRRLGWAIVSLGGGRRRPEDKIDPRVGLASVLHVGEKVETGQPLAQIHARTAEEAKWAMKEVRGAFTLGESAEQGPVVLRTLTHS